MNRQMIRQAQQLQRKMERLQEELEAATVTATAGGGVVTVVISGSLTIESIEIDPEVVTPEDVELLQDLIIAAVNEGMTNAQEMVNSKMGQITGGLNIPGLV